MSAMVMSELETLDAADIGALVELEEILFPGDSPWTRQMFDSELAAGHYYATMTMQALGLMPDGAVRASLLHYNTADDVERFFSGLDSLR